MFFLIVFSVSLIKAQPSFLKQVLQNGYSDARGIVCADDQSFIITGLDKTNIDTTGDMYAMKISNSGTIQWTKHYGLKKEDGGNSILKLADNNFLITGHSDFHHDECDGYLIKINEKGDKIWSILLGDSILDDVLIASIEDANGNIYSIGRTESFGSLKYDFYLTKVSADGLMIFQKHYGSANNEIGNSLTFTSDGNILMVGYSYETDNNLGDFFMVNCNKDGIENWRKNTVNLGNDILHKTIAINNNMCIVGQKFDMNLGLQTYIATIDNSGAILNENTTGFNGDDIIMSAILSNNGVIQCLAYTTSYGDTLGDVALMQFDMNCQLKSIGFFGTSDFDQCGDFKFQKDGSCIMVGKSGKNNQALSSLIIKTDASGLLGVNQVLKNDYILFPNPVKDILSIELKSEPMSESSASIYNMEGRCLKNYILNTLITLIDLADLPQGVYVVKVLSKNTEVFHQLIIRAN